MPRAQYWSQTTVIIRGPHGNKAFPTEPGTDCELDGTYDSHRNVQAENIHGMYSGAASGHQHECGA